MTIYKQFTCQGCLPTALAMLAGSVHTKAAELALIQQGFTMIRETYSLGIIEAFAATHAASLTVIVDNRYYAAELNDLLLSRSVTIQHVSVTAERLSQITSAYVLYLDNHVFGAYEHSPHFVVCTPLNKSKVAVHDPWTGEAAVMTTKKMFRAVMSLKEHLRYSPLIIMLEKYSGAIH